MSDCDLTRESMPLLLTESLDPARREDAHLHIEQCALCGDEWSGFKETWRLLGEVPEVEPPARLKQRFLATINPSAAELPANVVPFHRRPALRWLAQAAIVTVIAGGAYFAGHRTLPAEVKPLRPIAEATAQPAFSIAESRVIPASAINPTIEGRPDIQNISFSNVNPAQDEIGVSFDITSHVTVTGHPTDASMVRLMRYVLENEDRMAPSGSARAIDWVRTTYSQPGNANQEIANALGNVLRNDSHEGVRIKAAETLTKLPVAMAAPDTRAALISALKSDPNPAVRIKAVEALANLARNGATLDPATLDTLRQKASQDDENVYVRVKAAEALSNIRP